MDIEIELKALRRIGKSSATELYLQSWDKGTMVEEIGPELRTQRWNSSEEKHSKQN